MINSLNAALENVQIEPFLATYLRFYRGLEDIEDFLGLFSERLSN